MKARQIIYSSTIIVLGFIQASPIFICLASTIILLNVLGILYGILLVYIWSSTEKRVSGISVSCGDPHSAWRISSCLECEKFGKYENCAWKHLAKFCLEKSRQYDNITN